MWLPLQIAKVHVPLIQSFTIGVPCLLIDRLQTDASVRSIYGGINFLKTNGSDLKHESHITIRSSYMAFRLKRWVDLVSETQPFLYESPLLPPEKQCIKIVLKNCVKITNTFQLHKFFLHLLEIITAR